MKYTAAFYGLNSLSANQIGLKSSIFVIKNNHEKKWIIPNYVF